MVYSGLPSSRICYVKFSNEDDANVALHLQGTLFIDRILYVTQAKDGMFILPNFLKHFSTLLIKSNPFMDGRWRRKRWRYNSISNFHVFFILHEQEFRSFPLYLLPHLL